MTRVIDADTHIAEPPEMWDFLDPAWRSRRPVVVQVPEDTLYGKVDHMWLIDGQIYPRPAGRGGNFLVTPTAQTNVRNRVDRKARELLDLPMRLEDMQATNVDVQVVYPTLFLAYLTHDASYEVELCKAYNRFLADVWAKAEDRIRYVAIPPLRNIDASIEELRFGKEHGACGVFFRGIEGDKTLDDPYFFPVYEEAQSLGLPICIHQGQGAPALNYLIDVSRSHTFTHGRIPPVVAFRNLVSNKVPELFPDLRWGFIETGASWVPFAMYQLRGTLRADGDFWGPRLFDKYNMWIFPAASPRVLEEVNRVNPDYFTKSCPSLFHLEIRMRLDKEPWNDINVRRALSMSIDRDAVVATALRGDGMPVLEAWPLDPEALMIDGYPEDVQPYLQYNPEMAKQLLADAGYPDGFKTSVVWTASYGSPWQEVAETMLTMMRAVGIEAEFNMMEYGPFLGAGSSQSWDDLYFGWTNSFDLDDLSATYFWSEQMPANTLSLNPDAALNEIVERLWGSAGEAREAVAEELQVYVAENAYRITSPVWGNGIVARPEVKNVGWRGTNKMYHRVFENAWLDE